MTVATKPKSFVNLLFPKQFRLILFESQIVISLEKGKLYHYLQSAFSMFVAFFTAGKSALLGNGETVLPTLSLCLRFCLRGRGRFLWIIIFLGGGNKNLFFYFVNK